MIKFHQSVKATTFYVAFSTMIYRVTSFSSTDGFCHGTSRNLNKLLMDAAARHHYRGFTSSSSSSFSTAMMRRDLFLTRKGGSSSSSSNTRATNTGLHMNIFSNFFGGGAYGSLQVDYTKLDHPGQELAKYAKNDIVPKNSKKNPELELATFAGGCFWGLELAFQRVPGVQHTAVGYTQGKASEVEPTYNEVSAGNTAHTEAVVVYYNPKEISYDQLLDVFFDRVDPTTVNGQGRDYGTQYRTGVYYHSKEQAKIASARFETVKEASSRRIATELKPAALFWPAEKYHQQYLEKGGRFGTPQSAEKNSTDKIQCYG